MQSYMELIYIDSENLARKTNLCTAAATNAATLAAFRSYRWLSVDIKAARFLLDYHNAKGDLGDTIAIDADGFRIITGFEPKAEAEYCQIDTDYWNEARAERAAA